MLVWQQRTHGGSGGSDGGSQQQQQQHKSRGGGSLVRPLSLSATATMSHCHTDADATRRERWCLQQWSKVTKAPRPLRQALRGACVTLSPHHYTRCSTPAAAAAAGLAALALRGQPWRACSERMSAAAAAAMAKAASWFGCGK